MEISWLFKIFLISTFLIFELRISWLVRIFFRFRNFEIDDGILNSWWSDEKVCSYYDRTSCVNDIVEKYIFSSEPELVKKCPPLCETTEYKVTQSRYNDPRDDRILRRRFNLGPEYKGNISRIFSLFMLRLNSQNF